uniref:Origin recognition complex subunit 4 n=1 Tax=Caenorhabditis japonica TaxID=281687 RepID=A0A8R1I4I7_CAEJA
MLNKTDQAVIGENARRALEMLDNQVIGLAEQERQIDNIVYDFLQSKDGKCALLEGERNCGRESILRRVLEKYKKELRVINAGFVAADPNYQQELAREEDEGFSVFLVRDADKLITPQQQKFLYTMVDKATHFSWLVFFSVSRQDFAQNLQKQATSRIPKMQVSFDATHDYEEFCKAMTEFLMPSGSPCAKNAVYQTFINSLNFKTWLRPIFETSQLVVLKQIAAQLLMLFGYEDENKWTIEDVNKQIKPIVECSLPSYNAKLELLKDQTMRAQCVFFCVWKLLRNKESDGPLVAPKASYRTVFLEFKKLANQYYSSLDVSSDVFVFREIDHLVEMGLLKADESTNVTNTSFRKVWLHINEKIVEDVIKMNKLNLPSTVCDFFVTILK